MNSLPAKILAAVIAFILGVAVSSLWLDACAYIKGPIICPFPAEPPPKRLEVVFVVDTIGSMR